MDLKVLVVRGNAIRRKFDFPASPEWSPEFSQWLKKCSTSFEVRSPSLKTIAVRAFIRDRLSLTLEELKTKYYMFQACFAEVRQLLGDPVWRPLTDKEFIKLNDYDSLLHCDRLNYNF